MTFPLKFGTKLNNGKCWGLAVEGRHLCPVNTSSWRFPERWVAAGKTGRKAPSTIPWGLRLVVGKRLDACAVWAKHHDAFVVEGRLHDAFVVAGNHHDVFVVEGKHHDFFVVEGKSAQNSAETLEHGKTFSPVVATCTTLPRSAPRTASSC